MDRNASDLSRRAFIGATAMAMAVQAAADPASRNYHPEDAHKYDFLIGRVGYNNPDWDWYPGGEKNLLEQLAEVLRIKVKLVEHVQNEYPQNGKAEDFNALVDLTSVEAMRRYPMLFMTGMGAYRMDRKRRENLKQYLEEGGFILMDECSHPARGEAFYNSCYDSLTSVFGKSAIRRIPEDHEIYNNVNPISEPDFPRWRRPNSPGNNGLFIGDRLAALLCDADIHCGWTDPHNGWIKRAQHTESIMTGINIVAYVLSH